MRAIFVRHGQSTANTGLPCDDIATIALTDTGHAQAKALAATWTDTPDLIVTSPFSRTQQTARPTIDRFPAVPVEIWPIQEFTYLQPARWNGSTAAERMPHLERYWTAADPHYCDGDGAESFADLLERARAALERLAALRSTRLAYVFSHAQFIQAVRMIVVHDELDDQEIMRRFWRKGQPPAVRNAEPVPFVWSGGKWAQIVPPRELTV